MSVKSRRKSREAALRALYEVELGGGVLETALSDAAEYEQLSDSQRGYAESLANGVKREMPGLDRRLSALIIDYDYTRLAAVDRNLLRLGAYEILFEPSVPPAVTINEAVEIAKKFSTAESGRFVNGVLGKLLSESPEVSLTTDAVREESEPEQVIPVETVSEDSPEVQTAKRVGAWSIKSQ